MARQSFLKELKRRHVYRVAAAYVVVGWLLIQVATQVFPVFHLPDWIDQAVVLLTLAGFPIALVLAWAFDATPQGVVATDAAAEDGGASAPLRRRSRRAGIAVGAIGLLIALIAGGAYWHFGRAGSRAMSVKAAANTHPTSSPDGVKRNPGNTTPGSAADAAAHGLQAVEQAIPEKSVAALPFANDSGQPDQQYFSDGLSEDLITALSQFAGLKVISRDSAFQFRHGTDSSEVIGKKLGVAHLLEGSVQRQGSEVRITATLVNAADGSILWSQRYDKPYRDLFKLQDDIAHSVAAALKAKLLTAPGAVVQSDRPPSGNLAAYAAYLRGVSDSEDDSEHGTREAIKNFQQAIRIDSKYAAAYARLSAGWVWLAGGFLGGAEATQAHIKARAAVDAALALDPDLSLAHQEQFRLLENVDMDWAGAEAEARRALQLAPNDARAKVNLAAVLATLGHVGRALVLTRQALQVDPRSATGYSWLASYFSALGRFDEAAQAANMSIALQPATDGHRYYLASAEILREDAAAALAAARQDSPGPWRDITLALALQIGPNHDAADVALQNLVVKLAGNAAYQIAEVYALRGDPDNTFKWLNRAWSNRDGGIATLLYDPFILRYRNDPRFAAFCKKVGLPATTDAKALP